MFLEDYKDLIFNDLYYELCEKYKPEKEEILKLYAQNILFISSYWLERLGQRFAYNFIKLHDKGLCQLTETYWNDEIKQKLFYKPVIHYNRDDDWWGDMAALDGHHTYRVDKYQVRITNLENNASFIFNFDENNEDSLNAFYEIFSDYLLKDFFDKIIKKRIEEINKREIERLVSLSKEFIKNNKNEE